MKWMVAISVRRVKQNWEQVTYRKMMAGVISDSRFPRRQVPEDATFQVRS
jgi:hypothetical protein